MIEQLVGMQAQEPRDPYVALWSRIEGFDPAELSDLIESRRAVRAGTLRSTIHLLTDSDCLAIQPITQAVMTRVFKSPWEKGLAGAEAGEVALAGLELLADGPLTRAQLSELLAPDLDERRVALSAR